jgi:hypothetical protein
LKIEAAPVQPRAFAEAIPLKIKSFLSLVLSMLLLAPGGAFAQQTSGPQANLVETGALKIVVVQGEGAVNNVRARTATQPVVEVRDENDKPVEGAEVVFQLPAAGPGGVFHGWMRNQTARTNAQGQAAASGFTPNEEAGRFNIKVTATTGKRTGTAVIAQSNAVNGTGSGAQAKKSRKHLWIAIGVIAAAAIVGGAVAASRGDDDGPSGATANPVTITPGPVTVGNPR